jgi:hypothetical protein
MNINSIINEWTYRLTKGYPDSESDYQELDRVLTEMTDLSETQRMAIIRKAKGLPTTIVAEAIDVDSIDNQVLLDQISEVGKTAEFKTFLKLLPTEANDVTIRYLNNISEEFANQFASLLYSQQEMSEEALNKINYKSGINFELFNLDDKGLGKGEILLAALFGGSQIQGGTTSYDLIFGGQQYEIKDYTKRANASIRLGTKGSVTRFKFWDEITNTLTRISQLQGIDSPKFDFNEYFEQPFLDSINYLNDRRSFIMAGNLNLRDKRNLEQFYLSANKLNSDIDGYTNVILRGPNTTPIEMSIEPLKKTGEKIVLTPIPDNSQDITYINTELRRLRYVRNPELLDSDLQAAVDEIVGNDLLFIVFRNNRVNVTNDFRYYVSDAGRVRIVEKSILPEQIEDDSETELIEG